MHTSLIQRPQAEWSVVNTDRHEGYVSGEDYLTNEAKLAANRTNAGARPPREGSALCQGSITCDSCGKPMRTNYHTDQRPSYECSSRADRLTTPTYRCVVAATVDDAVAERPLDTLNPTEVALALAARERDEVSTGTSVSAAPSNAPATTQSGPNVPSPRSNRRTVWSRTPWTSGGRRNSPRWLRPDAPSTRPWTP